MLGTDGRSGAIGSAEVAEVRSLLRHPDIRSRRAALARIADWAPLPDTPEVGRHVLRAATATYPWVSGDRTDPGEVLAAVLWHRPDLLPVAELEGAYLIAGDRVRRSLLHLLARRRDHDGLASLAHLLGPDGPTDLLPLPTTWLLDPVLGHPAAGSLAPALAAVAGRRGWAGHASDLLRRLVEAHRLDRAERVRVAGLLAPLVADLVDACDRGLLDPPGGADRVRSDRRRLVALLDLLEVLAVPDADRLVLRGLSSADPRVGARAALAVVSRGHRLPPERIPLLARHPEALAVLRRGLEDRDALDLLGGPGSPGRTAPSRAEADLVAWLASETELGRPPDEVEHATAIPAADLGFPGPGGLPAPGSVHLIRFRMRSPHWSCARGWLVGLAGPYLPDGTVPAGVEPLAMSLYDAEDEDTPEGHARAVLASVAVWPEDPDAPGPLDPDVS